MTPSSISVMAHAILAFDASTSVIIHDTINCFLHVKGGIINAPPYDPVILHLPHNHPEHQFHLQTYSSSTFLPPKRYHHMTPPLILSRIVEHPIKTSPIIDVNDAHYFQHHVHILSHIFIIANHVFYHVGHSSSTYSFLPHHIPLHTCSSTFFFRSISFQILPTEVIFIFASIIYISAILHDTLFFGIISSLFIFPALPP